MISALFSQFKTCQLDYLTSNDVISLIYLMIFTHLSLIEMHTVLLLKFLLEASR